MLLRKPTANKTKKATERAERPADRSQEGTSNMNTTASNKTWLIRSREEPRKGSERQLMQLRRELKRSKTISKIMLNKTMAKNIARRNT